MRIQMIAVALMLAKSALAADVDFAAVRDEIIRKGDYLVRIHDVKAPEKTSDGFADLYFDVFEGKGLEAAIGAAHSDGKIALEKIFSQLISDSGSGASREELAVYLRELKERLAVEMSLLPAASKKVP